jgi:hypothetical protein
MILLVCKDQSQIERAKSIWGDLNQFEFITIGSILSGRSFERIIFLFDPVKEKLETRWTVKELVGFLQTKLPPNKQVEFL